MALSISGVVVNHSTTTVSLPQDSSVSSGYVGSKSILEDGDPDDSQSDVNNDESEVLLHPNNPDTVGFDVTYEVIMGLAQPLVHNLAPRVLLLHG